MISGTTKLAGVFATPIKHSLSPTIHNKAFKLLGIDAIYLAFDVKTTDFANAIKAITTFDMLGVNLSMPYKEMAVSYMDEIGPEVRLSSTINTIINRKGHLIGRNTDGIGYLASLKAAGYRVAGEQISILGGGGAALAIITQLALAGVKKISVFNRKSKHFAHILQKLKLIAEQTQVKIELFDLLDEKILRKELAKSIILTNTTSVGMGEFSWGSPIHNPQIIPKDILVTDIIYNPVKTKLLEQAQKREAKTMNGLNMLFYQAAESFFLWTGRKMPVAEIKTLA